MSAPLRDLLDHQAITEMIYRYCRAMAPIHAESSGCSIWHEDAVAEIRDAIPMPLAADGAHDRTDPSCAVLGASK